MQLVSVVSAVSVVWFSLLTSKISSSYLQHRQPKRQPEYNNSNQLETVPPSKALYLRPEIWSLNCTLGELGRCQKPSKAFLIAGQILLISPIFGEMTRSAMQNTARIFSEKFRIVLAEGRKSVGVKQGIAILMPSVQRKLSIYKHEQMVSAVVISKNPKGCANLFHVPDRESSPPLNAGDYILVEPLKTVNSLISALEKLSSQKATFSQLITSIHENRDKFRACIILLKVVENLDQFLDFYDDSEAAITSTSRGPVAVVQSLTTSTPVTELSDSLDSESQRFFDALFDSDSHLDFEMPDIDSFEDAGTPVSMASSDESFSDSLETP